MPDFGKRLIKLRKDRKLTQTELGELIGVAQTLVARWELNEGKPHFDYLVKLSEALEVSFNFLISGKEEHNPSPLQIKNKRLKTLCEKADQLSKNEQDTICEVLEKMVRD